MGNESGPQETDAIAESHKKEKRPCLAMAEAQIRLHDGQEGGHDDPGDEIQVEDENQEEERQNREGGECITIGRHTRDSY